MSSNAPCKCVLLFYLYVLPHWDESKLEDQLDWHNKQGSRLKLAGRIRVSKEGLNVNISGTSHDIAEYCDELMKWDNGSIKSIDFKKAEIDPKDEFRGLKVWRVSEICALGVEGLENLPGGRHVSPQEFHDMIKQASGLKRIESNENSSSSCVDDKNSSVVLLDARNLYETRIGRFESEASSLQFIAPPTSTFSELPSMLDNLHNEVGDLTGRTVLMYCTGGVRCERASQYLKLKHPEIGDIAQLSGGIHRYLEAFPDGGYWKGLNYVFDRREVHGALNTLQEKGSGGLKGEAKEEEKKLDGVNSLKNKKSCVSTDQSTLSHSNSIISHCILCSEKWASYQGKRRCSNCRMLVLVCNLCQSKGSDRKLPPPGLLCEICDPLENERNLETNTEKESDIVYEPMIGDDSNVSQGITGQKDARESAKELSHEVKSVKKQKKSD